MHTKMLADSTIIPYRIWDYVHNFALEEGYKNIPILKEEKKRLTNLNIEEFKEVLKFALEKDMENPLAIIF